jgi:hypothetical protein
VNERMSGFSFPSKLRPSRTDEHDHRHLDK